MQTAHPRTKEQWKKTAPMFLESHSIPRCVSNRMDLTQLVVNLRWNIPNHFPDTETQWRVFFFFTATKLRYKDSSAKLLLCPFNSSHFPPFFPFFFSQRISTRFMLRKKIRDLVLKKMLDTDKKNYLTPFRTQSVRFKWITFRAFASWRKSMAR